MATMYVKNLFWENKGTTKIQKGENQNFYVVPILGSDFNRRQSQ
jgi:hypothetical protein